jgi:TP901 family phage tail tape measure protein
MTAHFQRNAKRMKSDLKGIHEQIKKQNAAAKKMAANLTKVGKAMSTRVTLPLVAAGTAGVFAFAKLEKGLTKVKGLTDDKTWNRFEGQFKLLQKRAIEYGFSIEDVNESLFAMPSGLGVTEQAIDGYNAALKLAIAGDAKLSAATEGIIRILAGYGDEIGSAERAASGLFEAQVIGVTNVELLSGQIGKVIANSKLAKLSFGEMVSTAAGLTKVLPTEQALTAMNSLLASLLTPTEDQKKAIKLIKDTLGITLPKGAAELQKVDFFRVLEDIIAIAKKDPDVLVRLIPEARAVRAMGAMTTEIVNQVKAKAKIVDTDKKMIGLNRAFNDQMRTASQQLARLKGQFIIMAAQVGTELFPLIKSFVDKALLPAVKWFKALDPATKKWVVQIGLLVAIIGPLLLIMGKLISSFIALKKLFLFMGIIGPKAVLTKNIGVATKSLGLLRSAGLLVGTALAAWSLGKFIGEIKWVKENITGPIAESIFGTQEKRLQFAETKTLINTKINLIKALRKAAADQGFKEQITPIVSGVTTAAQAQTLISRLESGKLDLQRFAGKTPQEIAGKIIIETKDPRGVIKDVEVKQPSAKLGFSMPESTLGFL